MLRVSALVFAIAACLPACTLAGGAVGSTIPDYTPASVAETRDGSVSAGEKIAVVRESDGEEIVGKFRGIDSLGLAVETDQELVTIDPSDVRSVRVARDNHWLEGAAIGLAVDVAFVVFVGTRTAHAYPDTTALGGDHIGSDGVTVGAR